MIYGLKDGMSLIVAAADSLLELEEFYEKAVFQSKDMYVEERQPTIIEMMSEQKYSGFRKPPYVFTFSDDAQMEAFRALYEIEVIKPNRLNNLHEEMLDAMVRDPYATRAEGEERRTIGQIHDLIENDPWDERTEEQKQAEKAKEDEYKRMYDEAKKAGKLSGDDSFAAPKDGATARVTDIRTVVDQDGNVEITRVAGVKGLYEDSAKEATEAEARANGRLVETPSDGPMPIREIEAEEGDDTEADSEDMSIDPNGVIAIYYRVEIEGAKLDEVMPILSATGLPADQIVKKRNHPKGCWLAVVRQSIAENIVTTLTGAGFKAESEGVNDHGESIVPKGLGAEVIDTSAVAAEKPRPWNDLAYQLETMTPEELAENHKGYKAEEFIYCGYYDQDNGCIVNITPRSWFDKHKTMYEKPLDIAHILPDHLKERFPGVYQTRSLDWNGLSAELSIRRKMTESLWFQMYLNSIRE